MNTSGPTKGAELKDDPGRVWAAHPRLAALLRFIIVVIPLVLTILFSWWVGRVLPPERLGMNRWVWLACLFVVSTVLVLLFQRLLRRALPLVALMKLTLVFPDEAPSRARAALRASSGRGLVRRLQEGELDEEALDGDMLADLLTAINDHDRLTRGHSERVRAYTEVIGEEMGLPESEMNLLRWGALLHDVGKLTVPAEILNKDGPPTKDEWELLQGHPTAGGAIMEPLEDWLGEWKHAADQHHNHWDGKGYPGGLKGLDISLPGRMVAIADAYDVMTSARSYKKPLSHEVARQELTDCAGTQFDPAIVRVFLNAGLGRLRAAVGPLTWLVNGLSSGQAPIPVAGPALSAASAATTAAIAMVVSLAGGGPAVPDTLASAADDTPVVEDVVLAGREDQPITGTLTALGPYRDVDFTLGQPKRGELAVVDADADREPSGDGEHVVDVRYRPAADYHGSDSFSYTACGGGGDDCATATVTLEIASVNDAPTPTADVHAVFTGETAMIDVRANDWDRDGDTLDVRLVTEPRQGTAAVVDNMIGYRARSGFIGEDTVSYSVTDPGGMSGTATLTLTVLAAPREPDPTPTVPPTTVPPAPLPATPPPPTAPPQTAPPPPPPPVNRPPVAVDDVGVPFVTSEDVPFTTGDVTANDSDVDDLVVPSSVAVVRPVAHGSLVDRGDGTFRYTPDPEFFGVDSFTYTITDAAGAVSAPATATIVVVVVNDPPVAIDDRGAGFATSEDVTFTTGDVTVNDSDLDHPVAPSSVAVVRSAAHGGLVNRGDGTFRYTPDPEFSGADSFTYTITDPAGAVSVPAKVSLVVSSVNDAPVAADDSGSGFVTSEDVAFTTGDVTVNDSDVDGAVVPSSVAVVSSVSDGGLVNHGDGTFTYTPDPDFFGVDSFTYKITDSQGAISAPATVTIAVIVVNDAPVAADDSGVGFVTSEDTGFTTGDVTANDSDVDHAVVPSSVAVVSPVTDGGLVNHGDGTFTYTPDPDFFGVDSFTYTITDPAGAVSAAATVTLAVTGVNDAPVAAGDSGVGFATTEDVAFITANVTANDSDVDDPVVPSSVAVASPVTSGGLVNHGDGTFTYTPDPDLAGLDSFTYTITDAGGAASAPATVVLVVTGVNDAPVAADDSGLGFITSEDLGFTTTDVTANDSDVDHAVVASSVAVVSSVADGGLVNHGDGTFTYTPDPDFFGTDSFTYTITDPAGAVSAEATVTLTVTSVNDPPVAGDDAGVGFTTAEDTGFTTADVTANDSDVDHVVVASSVAVVSSVSDGALVNNGDGTFTYTPDPDFFGVDSFTYTITDPAGAVSAAATVTLTVTGVNDPPVAAGDSGVGFATTEDVAFTTANVTANDSDVDHAVDGSSVAVVSSVTDGGLVNHGDGTFTYTPDPDFAGLDSFTYTITDAGGAVSALATVVLVVTGVNDAPVAADDSGVGFVTAEDTGFTTADVTANDSDVDHAVVPSSVAIVSSVSDGGLVNHGDGTFTYTPDPDLFGTDSFTYTITDPAGAVSAAVTVTLTVTSVNDAPVAASDGGAGYITSEDVGFTTADATANDSDVDHAVVPSSVAVVSSVTDGGLVNHGDGTFTYTPDPDFFGVDSFTYSITDPAGATSAPATVTLTVTGVNDLPVAADDSGVGFATAEDVAFTTANVTANDSDVDDPVVPSSVTVASTVSNGALVDNGDGTFTYTPDPDFAGLDSFTYTINDPAGATSAPATVVLVVTGVNDAPVANDDTGVGFLTAEDTVFTTANVTANDSDVDHVVDASSVAVVSSVSDGGLVNHGDGTFTYTPDPDFFGTDSFTYTITDPAGATSAPATVTMGVVQVNDPPVAADDLGLGFATAEDTAFATADVTANDSDVDHAVVPSSVAVVSLVTDGGLVNHGDGTFTYTPDPDFFGVDSFTYTITDPAGATSAPATVTLAVLPTYDQPVANDDTLDVDQGASATTVDLRLNDDNPDLGPLTIESVTDGTNGTVVDNGDGTVTYTHDGSATISDSFTYTIEDLAGTQDSATVLVTIDLPPGTFIDAGQDLGPGSSFEVALGDIDGDGDLDAVFANDNEPNTVWTNDGTAVFTDSAQGLGSADSVAVALADIDGDGDLDLVFANTSSEPNTIWLNDDTGLFTDSGQALGSSRSEDVAVADVDGDGDLDLAFAEWNDDNTVWLNDGSGVFSDSGQSLGSGPTMGVSFGDLDGDGDPDLVFANDGADDTVWFNDGTGAFSDSGQALGIGRSHGSVLLDLDGDGDVDIAYAGDNEGDTVWLNDGAGTFTDSGQVLGLGHSRAISAGDLDGDGDVDLVFGDHTGVNTVWLNDGTAVFTDSTQTLGNGTTEGTAFGDLDGDGDLDAVTANDGDANRVWLNS